MIDRQIDRKQLVELRALALGSDRCWFQSLLFEDLTIWLRSGSYDLALHHLSFLICETLRGDRFSRKWALPLGFNTEIQQGTQRTGIESQL